MMEWIDITKKPPAYIDVLVTDGNRCWVAQTLDYHDIFLASHPDYKRSPENEFGAPFTTFSKPTHWMPLPATPKQS